MWTSPDPSADLVSLSILGVVAEEDNDLLKEQQQQQASFIRRKAAVTSRVTTPEDRSVSHSQTQKDSPSGGDDNNKELQPLKIVWRNVLIFLYLHFAALYGFYLCFTATKLATLSWCKYCHSYVIYLRRAIKFHTFFLL